ncbi:hypothetical protein TcasGA2_TC034754 [Tribolium castaneum]|uniref:Uncharacterized protein n=1 Tax=Tribolium castaneum TaxID=7070 RepID=A0A139WFS8_TRICA|nr:hypothetical protein TcasGA2_TC034754 [Tribolium castaneum]
MMIFGFFNTVVSLTNNTTVKAMGVVAACVIFEIMMYVILGLTCVFISLIIQIHDIVELKPEKYLEDDTQTDQRQFKQYEDIYGGTDNNICCIVRPGNSITVEVYCTKNERRIRNNNNNTT